MACFRAGVNVVLLLLLPDEGLFYTDSIHSALTHPRHSSIMYHVDM